MPLNALTLSVTSGVQGRPFSAVINGLTTGRVEVLNDGSPGFSTVNGRVTSHGLPYPVSTVVLREYDPGVGQGYRDSRIEIAAASSVAMPAQARAVTSADRSLRRYRTAAVRAADQTVTYSLVVEDDLGATTALALVDGAVEIKPPVGFSWDFTAYPVPIGRTAQGRFTMSLSPRALVNPAIWTGPVYYADAAAANNTGDGLSAATAVQSIRKAVSLLEASASAAGVVMVKAGVYDRSKDFLDTGNALGGGALSPTKPVAIIGYGGTVVNGPFAQLTYTADAGSYISARTNVVEVIDLLTADQFGDFVRLTKQADVATVNATNGWYQDGANIRIHRPDGAAVTASNTRVFLASSACCKPGTQDFYCEGIDWQGGNGGALSAITVATRNLAAVDCKFRYPGGPGQAAANAVAIDNMTGLAAFFRCSANKGTADGFNAHSTTGQLHLLTVDCKGYDNGRTGNLSNNGFTLHETVRAIDLNGDYWYGAGGTVRNIGATQMWALGTRSRDDRGDVIYGGTLQPTSFQIDDTSKLWGQEISASGAVTAIYATAGTTMRTRYPTLNAAPAGAGTIGVF